MVNTRGGSWKRKVYKSLNITKLEAGEGKD